HQIDPGVARRVVERERAAARSDLQLERRDAREIALPVRVQLVRLPAPVEHAGAKYPSLPAISSYALRGGLYGGVFYVAAHEARVSLDVRLDDLGGGGPRDDPRAEHPGPERPGPEDERVDRHGEGERHLAGEGKPEIQERRPRADLQGEGRDPGEPRRHR